MSKYKIGDKIENIILEDNTVFQKELDLISDDKLKDFVIKFLDTKVPRYFYYIPASSSGKFHPAQDIGIQGLVKHTQSVVRVALDLLRSEMFVEETDRNRDIIITACLLHDTFKNGIKDEWKTVSAHPIYAKDSFCKAYKDYFIGIGLEDKGFEIYFRGELIGSCILSHMGKWNTDKDTGIEILPKPESELQKLVHLADYIASRKYIDMSQLED